MKKHLNIILSVTSVIISISALCVAFIRCSPVEANWMAILVGSLSILVTFLVAWQIYKTIDVENQLKKIDKIYDEKIKAIPEDMVHLINSFEHRLSSYGVVTCQVNPNEKLKYLILSIEEVFKSTYIHKDNEYMNLIIDDISDLFKKKGNMEIGSKKLELSEEDKRRYISVLKKVEHNDIIYIIEQISRV